MMEKSTFRMVPRTMEPSEDRWGDEHVWTKSLDRAARRRIPSEKPGPPIKGRWLYQGKAHIWGQKSYKIIKHDQRMAKMNQHGPKLFRMTIFFLGMN